MARKNKIAILNDILDQVDKKELTINEIAESIESHWITVKDSLKFLKDKGLVEENITGNERRYKLAETVKRDNLTYYNIPTDIKTKRLALYLFQKIKNLWLEEKQTLINKTFMQKIAVDVIEEIKLPIPCGWYKFGKITLFNIDPKVDIDVVDKPKRGKDIDKQVRKSINKFKNFKYAWQAREFQYKKYNNIQYQISFNLELIGKRLVNLNSKGNKKALPEQLNRLTEFIPQSEETKEIRLELLKFISIINSSLAQEKDLNEEKIQIHNAYMAIWELVATYNFYTSLTENELYDKSTLQNYFSDSMRSKVLNARDCLIELESTS